MLRFLTHTRPGRSLPAFAPHVSRYPGHINRHKYIRGYGSASNASADIEFGIDDAPVLRLVKQRATERTRLLSELSPEMSSPEDVSRIRRIRDLEPISESWERWERERSLLRETTTLLASESDEDMRSLALADAQDLRNSLTELTASLPSLLLRDRPTSNLSALMEIKAGVGGAEAALFTSELVRMYERAATASNLTPSLIASSPLETGGMRDAIVQVSGPGAYDTFRVESGVHRVQRVPATETSGRTHTSTVAVVVLPLSEDDKSSTSSSGDSEAQDDLFQMSDVRVEVMRARGAGGQHVNKTESAVRLLHMPTGITVSMQDERSQHQNRRRAFQVLRARLLDRKMLADQQERRDVRRAVVKGADRSEKVRTYNFAQDRVTDHRIGLSVKNIQMVMEGDGLHEILDALKKAGEQAELEEMMEAEPTQ